MKNVKCDFCGSVANFLYENISYCSRCSGGAHKLSESYREENKKLELSCGLKIDKIHKMENEIILALRRIGTSFNDDHIKQDLKRALT